MTVRRTKRVSAGMLVQPNIFLLLVERLYFQNRDTNNVSVSILSPNCARLSVLEAEKNLKTCCLPLRAQSHYKHIYPVCQVVFSLATNIKGLVDMLIELFEIFCIMIMLLQFRVRVRISNGMIMICPLGTCTVWQCSQSNADCSISNPGLPATLFRLVDANLHTIHDQTKSSNFFRNGA